MYVYKLLPSSVSMAHGGPATEDRQAQATPTQWGRFVIGSIGQHISSQRWPLSAVPWGTPIRLDAKKDLEVQLNGRWQLLYTLPGWREKFAAYPAGATQLFVQEYIKLMKHLQLVKYGLKTQAQMPAPWNGQFPKTWVLNDFGPTAVKYFRDSNNNRKLDGKEHLLSDFIHTTPYEEMETLISRTIDPVSPMNPGQSHGCIHMTPKVLQDWVAKGILAVGATLEVHKYTESQIPPSFDRPTGRLGREIHFFPGVQGIALYNVTQKQIGHALHLR